MAREIIIIGPTAYIPLTQEYVATVDASDIHLVKGYNWTVIVRSTTVYVYRKSKGKTVLLHRVIMDDPDGMTIDHRDGNGLNNTRSNLRIATKAQNNRNQKMTDRNTSGYKGVSWHKKDRKWRAYIHVNNKYIHLGHFSNVEDARRAYAEASIKLHAEFGRTV